jgi:hypothetical protein
MDERDKFLREIYGYRDEDCRNGLTNDQVYMASYEGFYYNEDPPKKKKSIFIIFNCIRIIF